MKTLMLFAAAMLIFVPYSVQAEPPDPTPGATKPVREQNLDANDWIAVHEQGEADVNIVNDQAIDVNVTGGAGRSKDC